MNIDLLLCILDIIVRVFFIWREYLVQVWVMLGDRLRLKYLFNLGGWNLQVIVMFGLFSFMVYLMVVVLFLMMFVDIVSLGFEFFLLMVEKMKNNDILLL